MGDGTAQALERRIHELLFADVVEDVASEAVLHG